MKKRKLRLRFEPDARFEVTPVPTAPFRGTHETELDRLKARLLLDLLRRSDDPDVYPLLRRAANDAAAVAWTTSFPLLVFPGLLEEKADAARRQHEHQRAVLQRCGGQVNKAAA